jgi:hypothetical protein
MLWLILAGYAMSQQVRKRIKQGCEWVKTIGSLCKLLSICFDAVRGWTTWTFAAYNLIQLGGIGEWCEPSPM